eukprot:TRINITY_DN12215_c0_g1_i2.p1 TRINITY_DN12215_c0_g1~~TRINITY_DN12215_c0_g1_i2.p1  ORF type:complete len:287 (+),score=38.49 TRINITY_DN12215_c0_g1_i2:49-909(+)
MATLLADSGSTKCEWTFLMPGVNRSDVSVVSTMGVNPQYMDHPAILAVIESSVLPLKKEKVENVIFYGAGCVGAGKEAVEKLLSEVFTEAKVIVESDLVAAARALCGDKPGIAAILGTGSNSCVYDGEKIVSHCPPLGFLLGDEGSGATMGRKLLVRYIRGQLPQDLVDKFESKYGKLTKEEVIENVYKKPMPQTYVGGFAKFLLENSDNTCIQSIVESSFDDFFSNCIDGYDKSGITVVHFIGSIAYHFGETLDKVAKKHGKTVGLKSQSTFDLLIEYHLSQLAK